MSAPVELDFPGVNSDAHVKAERPGIVADRQTAVHSTGGPIEDGGMP